MEQVHPRIFLSPHHSSPIIDVRSPEEYNKGHIPGAINLPLFTDQQRAAVGTIYKRKGKDAAIQKGLEYVGPRMAELALAGRNAAGTLQNPGPLRVYCFRGGMRSQKMAWLFNLFGIQCTLLRGGYKAYRTNLLHTFKNLPHLIVLHGPTGSGKTHILHQLKQMGQQVLDLEGTAMHRGSAFGALGMPNQPTTHQFQNNLHSQLLNLNPQKTIWIEAESLTIGKVYLPETLWQTMNNAPVYEIQVPLKERVKHLVKDYGQFPADQLAASIQKITRKFGGHKVRQCLQALQQGDLHTVATHLLEYYDSTYNHSLNKYQTTKPIAISCPTADPIANARHLIQFHQQQQNK